MEKNWRQSITYQEQQFIRYYIEEFGDTYEVFFIGDAMCKRGKYCITCGQKENCAKTQAASWDLPKGETAMTDDILCFFLF